MAKIVATTCQPALAPMQAVVDRFLGGTGRLVFRPERTKLWPWGGKMAELNQKKREGTHQRYISISMKITSYGQTHTTVGNEVHARH